MQALIVFVSIMGGALLGLLLGAACMMSKSKIHDLECKSNNCCCCYYYCEIFDDDDEQDEQEE